MERADNGELAFTRVKGLTRLTRNTLVMYYKASTGVLG